MMLMTISGTLIRKIEPHQKWLSSRPPSIGPSGMPTAIPAVITATALARSPAGKRLGMIDIPSGMMNAPPRPITVRTAIRVLAESVRVPTSEAAPKRVSPAMSSRRRPKRSPSSPAGSMAAAKTTR